MHEVYLNSVADTILFALPLVALVALAIFRLDALFATSKGSPGTVNHRRSGCRMDANGNPVLVDPDGTLSKPKRSTNQRPVS
jgi:hypothetical protein